MQIKELARHQPGPADWFTGAVYVDTVATPTEPSRLGAASVHFTPGARTAWHTHPFGQNIYVLEGIGRCQREGGPVEEIRPGDRVFFEPGENHWHGAAPNRFMTHSPCRSTTTAAALSRGAGTSRTRSTAPRPPSDARRRGGPLSRRPRGTAPRRGRRSRRRA